MLPEAARHFSVWIAILALISIIYGALVAMAQKDMKKLIAYSSVNHMGYVMLGIAAAAAIVGNPTDKAIALNGAILQMFSHGLITGALFLLVGVVYERTHNRDLDQFGGLGAKIPIYGGLLAFMSFASLGLPGLAGFVSEFFIFRGAIPIYTVIAGLGVIGIIVNAAYLLWMIQRVLLGPLNPRWADIRDVDAREVISLTPLVALTILVGILPSLLVGLYNGSVVEVVQMVSRMVGG